MASKNVTQVLIAGKVYSLSGYESEEYLQKVAAYLNAKIAEIQTMEGYSRLSQDMRSLLLNLNTADDYFKLKQRSDELSAQIAQKERELYELKHELITAQMNLETAQKALSSLQEDHSEDQKKIRALQQSSARPAASQPDTGSAPASGSDRK